MELFVEFFVFFLGRKVNIVIWLFGVGFVLYGVFCLIIRKRISVLLYLLVKNVNFDLVDEVGYRVVLIGFLIFMFGVLIFVMIWV